MTLDSGEDEEYVKASDAERAALAQTAIAIRLCTMLVTGYSIFATGGWGDVSAGLQFHTSQIDKLLKTAKYVRLA